MIDGVSFVLVFFSSFVGILLSLVVLLIFKECKMFWIVFCLICWKFKVDLILFCLFVFFIVLYFFYVFLFIGCNWLVILLLMVVKNLLNFVVMFFGFDIKCFLLCIWKGEFFWLLELIMEFSECYMFLGFLVDLIRFL